MTADDARVEAVTVYRCQHCWSAEPMVGHGEFRALPAATFDALLALLAVAERERDEAKRLLAVHDGDADCWHERYAQAMQDRDLAQKRLGEAVGLLGDAGAALKKLKVLLTSAKDAGHVRIEGNLVGQVLFGDAVSAAEASMATIDAFLAPQTPTPGGTGGG